jgi:hypothetical protein
MTKKHFLVSDHCKSTFTFLTFLDIPQNEDQQEGKAYSGNDFYAGKFILLPAKAMKTDQGFIYFVLTAFHIMCVRACVHVGALIDSFKFIHYFVLYTTTRFRVTIWKRCETKWSWPILRVC